MVEMLRDLSLDLLPDLFDPVLEDLTAVITVDYVLGTCGE